MKNLIISPHVDDEVLGCSSFLCKETFVVYCGINEFHIVNRENRIKEVCAVADFMKFSYEIAYLDKVNSFQESNFINYFEKVINHVKPYRVLIPFPSYNQDHRAIYNAAMVALRPHDKNFWVKEVLMYEEIDCLWGSIYELNCFKEVDMKRKLYAYFLHASQVRKHRNAERLTTLAKLRGHQSGLDYAEGFIIKRHILE